ncbi:hypothetical protein GCM10008967_14270 [Bacillus carboniphilus]|uniref:Hemerythrin-like domain-containing protein n=1 Tax=Bacillus carboniphilus TaxID=86663 RepID=A0ABN0W4D6_9BACI
MFVPMNCGMSGNNEIKLCAPLQRLKKEHTPLTLQMEDLNELALKIGKDSSIDNWKEPLLQLRENVKQFISELDPHSEREEGVLFPMIGRYIGITTGPIAVMEYEHEKAKSNINRFLELTVNLQDNPSAEAAEKLASYVIEAYLTLSEHFMKEENVLFPMAERMLTAEEKEELELKINQI